MVSKKEGSLKNEPRSIETSLKEEKTTCQYLLAKTEIREKSRLWIILIQLFSTV